MNLELRHIEKIGILILVITGLVMAIVLLNAPIIIQEQSYHNFIDTNMIFGIPNFMNVISNLPFLIVGCYGFFNSKQKRNIQFTLLYLGIIGIAFGSSYYHLNPNNNSLVWDRIPMTIAFMAILSIVISEFINTKIGKQLLFPLLILGVFSVLFWMLMDDLRMYVFVQFYPILAIVIMLMFFKSKNGNKKAFWILLFAYVVAKLFEYYDSVFFNSLIGISGHTLKHILSAIGLYVLIKSFKRERQTASIAIKI